MKTKFKDRVSCGLDNGCLFGLEGTADADKWIDSRSGLESNV